jgi:hypothetical protein
MRANTKGSNQSRVENYEIEDTLQFNKDKVGAIISNQTTLMESYRH